MPSFLLLALGAVDLIAGIMLALAGAPLQDISKYIGLLLIAKGVLTLIRSFTSD